MWRILYDSEMARRWTNIEEKRYRRELRSLYVRQNKTIKEIAEILNIAEQTVYQRLCRLSIKTQPHLKESYLKKRKDLVLPNTYTAKLAEFFGVMLGDGHVSHYQIVITLGTKEINYINHVRFLIEDIFHVLPSVSIRKTGYRDIYLGSVEMTQWLKNHGLASNKIMAQVDVPRWIFAKMTFMNAFLRGFFDTDGSVYKLRYGLQISFTNLSRPILVSLQSMLSQLGYKPSRISANKVYLTKVSDTKRFFTEVKPKNSKHTRRYKKFIDAPVG